MNALLWGVLGGAANLGVDFNYLLHRGDLTPRSEWVLNAKYLEMTKQDMEDGKINDWGSYVGRGAGYAVCEGNRLDVYKNIQHYAIYYIFTAHEMLSIDEVTGVIKSLTE